VSEKVPTLKYQIQSILKIENNKVYMAAGDSNIVVVAVQGGYQFIGSTFKFNYFSRLQ